MINRRVFFFKQKTAYEMLRSLVGSEMCIRDRALLGQVTRTDSGYRQYSEVDVHTLRFIKRSRDLCLLYTSDAADDLLCVDLGGRRIIKKKNT